HGHGPQVKIPLEALHFLELDGFGCFLRRDRGDGYFNQGRLPLLVGLLSEVWPVERGFSGFFLRNDDSFGRAILASDASYRARYSLWAPRQIILFRVRDRLRGSRRLSAQVWDRGLSFRLFDHFLFFDSYRARDMEVPARRYHGVFCGRPHPRDD